MRTTTVGLLALATLCGAWAASPYSAMAGATAPVEAAAAAATPTVRDAGIRYGQATGAAFVCENFKTTEKAESLTKAYSGADLDTFKQQAETVLAAWKKTLTCEKTGDPNQCRLIHQLSCSEAMKEIGPNGTVIPGLVTVQN